MKRAVLILMLLTAASVATIDRVEAQAGEPTFSVEDPRLDIGKIKAGSEAVATFVFRNNGPNPVRILKAKPS